MAVHWLRTRGEDGGFVGFRVLAVSSLMKAKSPIREPAWRGSKIKRERKRNRKGGCGGGL